MQYKIEIYLNEKLLFATDPDTIKTVDDLVTVFDTLNRKFPEQEGYTLDVRLSVWTFSRTAWTQITNAPGQVILLLHE